MSIPRQRALLLVLMLNQLDISEELRSRLMVVLTASTLSSADLERVSQQLESEENQLADKVLDEELSSIMGSHRAEYIDSLTNEEWEALN